MLKHVLLNNTLQEDPICERCELVSFFPGFLLREEMQGEKPGISLTSLTASGEPDDMQALFA